MNPKNKKTLGESSFNHLYNRYKNSAKRRLLEFNLTKEELKLLTSKHCFYCDIKPIQQYVYCKGCNGNYIYNGIDRINNSIGYIFNNCVTCCKICNKMKGTMSHNEFIKHIKKISNRFV